MTYTEDDVERIANVLWNERGFTSYTKDLQKNMWDMVLRDVETTLQAFGAMKIEG